MPAARPLVSAWLPVLIWAGVIWLLGMDEFSAPETSRILDPLIAWLLPELDAANRMQIVAGLRKLAHPGVYGVLAALAYRAVARTADSLPRTRIAVLAMLPVLLLSVADEWRQSGSTARTGAAFDVGLDLAGGLVAIGLAVAIGRRSGRAPFAARRDA